MALTLHNIHPKKGSKKKRKRIGRGDASSGTYSGRGLKGQRSRSGGKSGLKLKGLRAIMLAQPKNRGFKSHRIPPVIVNVSNLNKAFADGAKVNPKALLNKGLIESTSSGVKILARGDVTVKLTIENCRISESAKAKIEQAGGKVL